MSPALACLVLALLFSVPAGADAPKPKGWPAAGLCITPWPSKPASACIQVSPADARTIQRLIIAYVDRAGRKDYRPAKAIALRPITESSIGGFMLYGYDWVDYTGDVLQAVAVESHENGVERGFKVTLGRNRSGWALLHFDHYTHHDPKLD
jgi:hypothetical protein